MPTNRSVAVICFCTGFLFGGTLSTVYISYIMDNNRPLVPGKVGNITSARIREKYGHHNSKPRLHAYTKTAITNNEMSSGTTNMIKTSLTSLALSVSSLHTVSKKRDDVINAVSTGFSTVSTSTQKTCGDELGIKYQGKVSVTRHGITCQKWTSQRPHRHNMIQSWQIRFPDRKFSEAENFCRNPDHHLHGPWCYTVNPLVRWQLCDVKLC